MRRCMVVDDSSVIRKVAKRILSGPEMIVVEAASGQEALAMCHADLPDVIVVDASLPDMDAVAFIREAMSIDPMHKPQVALCMTQFDIGAIMRAKRAGASGYLLKPFNRQQLLDRFRDMSMAA
jgi:two-component system, chemotaxis family, chemotaxis protein CheY